MAEKDENLVVRIDAKTLKELAKEAEADERTLSSYVRHLLKTHPKRQQKKVLEKT